MTSVVDDLLHACFPEGTPKRLDRLVDRSVAAEQLEDFKLQPVFPLDDPTRPVRLMVSAGGERDRWQQVVAEQWPAAALAEFLEQGPPPTRWMLDSDGSNRAVVYLDDLHRTELDLLGPRGLPLMCLTLDLASGAREQLTRHDDPPVDEVDGAARAGLERLLATGAVGLWALRWRGGRVRSVAWVSESRWRGNPASARRAVRVLGGHPRYDAVLDGLAAQGRVGYPDVVELFRDGARELTLGVL